MDKAGVISLFVVGMVVMVGLTLWCVRVVVSANRQLLDDLALLRAETLEAFRGAQHEENARLVADTRAATAKMNAMADALWSGLQGTVDSS
jgi:cell division protein FtsB